MHWTDHLWTFMVKHTSKLLRWEIFVRGCKRFHTIWLVHSLSFIFPLLFSLFVISWQDKENKKKKSSKKSAKAETHDDEVQEKRRKKQEEVTLALKVFWNSYCKPAQWRIQERGGAALGLGIFLMPLLHMPYLFEVREGNYKGEENMHQSWICFYCPFLQYIWI